MENPRVFLTLALPERLVGIRLLSYILRLVQPEVQVLGGEFIPSILRLLLPVPGKALSGGDTAVNKQPLPSWSLPSRGGEQRVSCLFVIDGIKQVKQSDMVSSIYCCIMTPFLKLSGSKHLFNLLVILQSGLNSAVWLFCSRCWWSSVWRLHVAGRLAVSGISPIG